MIMISTNSPAIPAQCASIPALLTPALWQHVVDTFELSPQQARIVSLILQGKPDKLIAAEMGLTRDTIRTYLRRVFDRMGVDDRVGVVLCIFALCLDRMREGGCHTFV